MMYTSFKFLDSYSKKDIDIFFGRKKETEDVYNCLFKSRLLLLYGASGTGKTSILDCGVANQFHDTDWLPVHIRRRDNLLTSTEKALKSQALTEVASQQNLLDTAYSVYLDHFKPIYLIYDQFEELFISGSKAEETAFIEFVSAVLKSGYNIKIIIVVREEYIANFNEFEKKIPDFFNNRYRVEHITLQKSILVVTEICKYAGIKIEDGIAPKIIDKVTSKANKVELTYLQVYLDRMLQYCKTNGIDPVTFNNEIVEQTGTIEDVLAAYLEEQIHKSSHPELAWLILKKFITDEGTKSNVQLTDLLQEVEKEKNSIQPSIINELIQSFLTGRIIKHIENSENTYEITHDSLAQKIWEKLSAEERSFIEIRQLISTSYKNHLSGGTYLNAKQLALVRPYYKQLKMPEEMNRYIEKSIHYRRRQRFLLNTSIISIFLLLTAGIITLKISAEREKASAEKAEASAEEALSAQKKATSAAILAKKNADTARLNQLLAVEKAKEADSERRRAEEANNVLQKQNSDSRDILLTTKVVQNNPTRALKNLLGIYDNIDNDELRQMVRQNVYNTYQSILYTHEITLPSAVQKAAANTALNTFIVLKGDNKPILLKYYNGKHNLLPLPGHLRNVYYCNYLLNHDKFITIDESNEAIIWNMDGRAAYTFKLPPEVIEVLSTAKQKSIIACIKNGDYVILDRDMQKVEKIRTNLIDITCASPVSKSQQYIFMTGSTDGTLSAWRKNNTSLQFDYKQLDISGTINAIALSPDEKTLALSAGGFISLYHVDENDTIISLRLFRKISHQNINKLVFRNEESILFASNTGQVYIYNVRKEQITEMQGHVVGYKIADILVSTRQNIFVTGGYDSTIKFWDPEINQPYNFQIQSKKLNTGTTLKNTRSALMINHKNELAFELNGIQTIFNIPPGRDDFSENDNIYFKNERFAGDTAYNNARRLSILPVVRVDKGREIITRLEIYDNNTLACKIEAESINNKPATIMYGLFSTDGKYILVKSQTTDFTMTMFKVLPTFEGIVTFKNSIRL